MEDEKIEELRDKLNKALEALYQDLKSTGGTMEDEKIEELRDKLNKALETKPPNDGYVLRLSEELDKLIVEYCRNKLKTRSQY